MKYWKFVLTLIVAMQGLSDLAVSWALGPIVLYFVILQVALFGTLILTIQEDR